MREKERKREVFIGCRCALFLLFLSVSSLFLEELDPIQSALELFSWSEREREHETEKTETRNDGASSAALPSRGNKERPTMMIFSSS